MYLQLDLATIPEEDWLDIIEVLKLGNTLAKALSKPEGVVHSITAAYMRHQAALYAYNY